MEVHVRVEQELERIDKKIWAAAKSHIWPSSPADEMDGSLLSIIGCVCVCQINNNKQNARFPLSVTSFVFKGIPVLVPDLKRESEVCSKRYLPLPLALLMANAIALLTSLLPCILHKHKGLCHPMTLYVKGVWVRIQLLYLRPCLPLLFFPLHVHVPFCSGLLACLPKQ